ncbi:hypothetical protein [Acidiferrobacter thiooxydans]|jgi:hypothetical protein|uniref:hypothetical protein n=1 Tax=Acidiferrobacter thiooxydans TaxID=163359 RepID=UPI0014754F2D|nr:hypothetical protein [Acidiferrobacter thiooxydans]UEN98381.1 hypothetical protein A9R16_007965 [Acidiferrobacter thiooxydans]
MPTHRKTPEQEAIITAIRDGRNVGVQVCAGAGKSRRLLVTSTPIVLPLARVNPIPI